MENIYNNSWHDRRVTKQTIEQLDISTANKEILLKLHEQTPETWKKISELINQK